MVEWPAVEWTVVKWPVVERTVMERTVVERRTDCPGRRVLRTSIDPAPLTSRRPPWRGAAQGILATPT